MTTKIKYKFINGEILEVEVDDIIAAFIFKDRTREASANRKERRYNFSLEAALYEDEKFYAAPEGNPDQRMIQFEQYEEILKFIETLTEVQKRRLFMRLAGMSYREIARKERVAVRSVADSIDYVRAKFQSLYVQSFSRFLKNYN
ncbi:MAG: hypothetical protein E7299_03550 [Lachnospiraceae bacterium]|nr:hypothetical protein [Lachnospiraceae bacterium]